MSRIVISIITALFCVTSVVAQNKTTLLQRINEIKSQNELYFWDQYTHPDADTAKIGATKRLLLDVNSNRSEDAQLSVEEVMPHASYINIDRGNLKQYFVYIKKADAIAQGQILQFGKLKDVEDYSSFDLILFDMQSQQIITMLSPVTISGSRTNVVNGSEDSLDNYPTNMTAVIWYIKK